MASTRIMKGLQGNPDQSNLLRRREYVADIPGSVGFANTQYAFNPGLPNLFPWASQFANSYDEYIVESANFVFEPESSSSATGTVILSFDYDSTDPAPVDKVSALETKDSVRSAPWVPSRLILKTADLKKRCSEALFTRNGAVSNTDVKTYDLGNLNVSTAGQASTATVGELWLEYTIQLRVPQRNNGAGVDIAGGGSISKTAVFGTLPVSLGAAIPATASGSVVTFQVPGYYLLVTRFTGTGLNAGVSNTPVASSGSTLVGVSEIANSADTGAWRTDVVRMLANGTVTYDLSSATTVTASNLDIAPWFSISAG